MLIKKTNGTIKLIQAFKKLNTPKDVIELIAKCIFKTNIDYFQPKRGAY